MTVPPRNEERYRLLFEQSLDAVYVGCPDGSIVEANQAWLELFGYTRDEIPRIKAIDFYVNPAQRADFMRRIEETGFIRDEVLYKRKDGTQFLCQRSLVAQRDESGSIVTFHGINRDVSRLRNAEAALHASERRYRMLFERSLDAIYIGTPDGQIIDVNQAWLDLFGYTREELPRLRAEDFYADPSEREDFVRRMDATGFVHDEVRYRRKDGSVFDCERSQVALKDETGGVVAFQGVNRDITVIKRARAALRDSEQRYRMLFEQSLDAIYVATPDGTSVEANQAWLDLFGYTREDLPALKARDLYVTPEKRDYFLRQINESGHLRDEVPLMRKDGTAFDCERSVVALKSPSGAVMAYQGVYRDITERKRAAQALSDSEERYRTLFEHSMDAISLVSPGGLLLDANRAWLDLFGYSAEDIGVANVEELYLDPDDRTRMLERLVDHDELVDDELQLRRRDGTVMDCLRTAVVRRDAGGDIIGDQSVVRDITEKKRAERALRQSEERFRSLFEQSMDAIYLGSPGGEIVDVNQAWLDLFGYASKDLPLLRATDLYADPAERQTFLRKMRASGYVRDEVRFRKKDGSVFDCERNVVARRDDKGNVIAYQGLLRDVTQRKRDHAELERLARFDALTALLNRRSILDKVAEWILHVRRYKGHLSVVMLDIDHFKLVNDRLGHQVGDRVLTDVAALVQRSVRKTDFVGRYGGEEFLIALPRTDAAGAAIMAERTRAMVQGTAMHDGEGGAFEVTASFGVAEWCDGDNDDSLIRRADAALYRAKQNGRNRVEIAPCSNGGP